MNSNGIEYPAMLRRRGFDASNFEVRGPTAQSAPNAEFYPRCLAQLRPLYLKLGALTEVEIEETSAALADPARIALPLLMAAGWVTRARSARSTPEQPAFN